MQSIIESHINEFDQWEYSMEEDDNELIKILSVKMIEKEKDVYLSDKIDANKQGYLMKEMSLGC